MFDLKSRKVVCQRNRKLAQLLKWRWAAWCSVKGISTGELRYSGSRWFQDGWKNAEIQWEEGNVANHKEPGCF